MPAHSYSWDVTTRNYIDGAGHALKSETIREYVSAYVEKAKETLLSKLEAYRSGEINLPQLTIDGREIIKEMRGAATVIAYGGREQMTVKEWGQLGSDLKEQFQYWNSFMREIADTPLSELGDAFVSRGLLYADGAYSQYENSVMDREKDAGVQMARRVCENDDSTCDGCAEAATDEFIPIDEVLPIGEADCLSRCRCYVDYADAEAA